MMSAAVAALLAFSTGGMRSTGQTHAAAPPTESAIVRKLESIDTRRTGRREFADRLRLLDRIERIGRRAGDREAGARFALYRLRAAQALLRAIPFKAGSSEPYRSWIAQHPDIAVYNAPGGDWTVDDGYI